jgi:hypothetical protein
MDIAVVFDTNAYRNAVRGKTTDEIVIYFSRLRELEKKKNVKAICSVFTGYELLPYLSKSYKEGSLKEWLKSIVTFGMYKSESYKECYKSIIALGTHCWDDNTTPPGIPSIPQTSLLITWSFFDKRVNEETQRRNKNLIGVLQDIYKLREKGIKYHKSSLKEIAKDIQTKEKAFADKMTFLVAELEKIILLQNPGRDKETIKHITTEALKGEEFRIVMAKALLSIYGSTVGITLSDEKLLEGAKILNEKLPITAGFHIWVCHEVYSKSLDLYSKKSRNKRWNWLWDAEISCAISESTINGRETWLVTGDKPMTEVLIKYGYQNRVMTLEKYLAFLEN